METVPYMEKGIVVPVRQCRAAAGRVHDDLLLLQASVQLQEALKQEDAKFVVLPLKRDVAIGDINLQKTFTAMASSSLQAGCLPMTRGYPSLRAADQPRARRKHPSGKTDSGSRNTSAIRNRWIWMQKGCNGLPHSISGRPSVEIAGHFKNGQMYMKLLDEIHDARIRSSLI